MKDVDVVADWREPPTTNGPEAAAQSPDAHGVTSAGCGKPLPCPRGGRGATLPFQPQIFFATFPSGSSRSMNPGQLELHEGDAQPTASSDAAGGSAACAIVDDAMTQK
jgi:hypothetical protein